MTSIVEVDPRRSRCSSCGVSQLRRKFSIPSQPVISALQSPPPTRNVPQPSCISLLPSAQSIGRQESSVPNLPPSPSDLGFVDPSRHSSVVPLVLRPVDVRFHLFGVSSCAFERAGEGHSERTETLRRNRRTNQSEMCRTSFLQTLAYSRSMRISEFDRAHETTFEGDRGGSERVS